MNFSTVYIDENFASEYSDFIPKTVDEIRDIEENTKPCFRFSRTELVEKGIYHIEVAHEIGLISDTREVDV